MNLAVVYNGDTLAFVPSSRPFRRGTELSMFSMRDNGGQSSKSRFGQPN
jgi:hypothetical protein